MFIISVSNKNHYIDWCIVKLLPIPAGPSCCMDRKHHRTQKQIVKIKTNCRTILITVGCKKYCYGMKVYRKFLPIEN